MALVRMIVIGLDDGATFDSREAGIAGRRLPTWARLSAEGANIAPTLLPPVGLPVQVDVDGTVVAAAHRVRIDRFAPSRETEQADMSDRDRRAIAGMLEGLGYL